MTAGQPAGPCVQAPGRVAEPARRGVPEPAGRSRCGRGASRRWPGDLASPIVGGTRAAAPPEGKTRAAALEAAVVRRGWEVAQPLATRGRRALARSGWEVAQPLATQGRRALVRADRAGRRAMPRRGEAIGVYRRGVGAAPGLAAPPDPEALEGEVIAARTALNGAPGAGPRLPAGNAAPTGPIGAPVAGLPRRRRGTGTRRQVRQTGSGVAAWLGQLATAVGGPPRPEQADLVGLVREPVTGAGVRPSQSAGSVRLLAGAAATDPTSGPSATRPAGGAAQPRISRTVPGEVQRRHPAKGRVFLAGGRAETVPRATVSGSPGDAAKTVLATRRCPPR